MALPIRANVFAAGFAGDPTIAPGHPGDVGSLLPRLGTTELYQKVGPLDTDWSLFGAGFGTFQNVDVAPDDTTNSAVYVPVAGTSLVVPIAGTYLAIFNTEGHNDSVNRYVYYAFYVNGVYYPGSERHRQGTNNGQITMAQPVVIPAGGTLAVYWRVDAGNGFVHERNLTILKIA